MLTLAEKRFKKLVWQLFQQNQNKLILSVRDQTDSTLDVEIRLPGKNVGFRVMVTSTATEHSEQDPDPRGFGDSQAVVQAAMQSWYPGKMNHWTERKREFTLQAWNLPDETMRDFTARYQYDPTNCSNDWSEGYELEKIYQLIISQQKTHQAALKAEQELRYAEGLDKAFQKLLKV